MFRWFLRFHFVSLLFFNRPDWLCQRTKARSQNTAKCSHITRGVHHKQGGKKERQLKISPRRRRSALFEKEVPQMCEIIDTNIKTSSVLRRSYQRGMILWLLFHTFSFHFATFKASPHNDEKVFYKPLCDLYATRRDCKKLMRRHYYWPLNAHSSLHFICDF